MATSTAKKSLKGAQDSEQNQRKNHCPPDGGGQTQEIDVPLGLEVSAWQTKKDVMVQPATSAAPVAGKVTFWFGEDIQPQRIQSIVGTIKMIARKLRDEYTRAGNLVDCSAYAHWDSARDGIEIVYTSGNPPGANTFHVGITTSATFAHSTMAFDIAMNNLINAFLERAKAE